MNSDDLKQFNDHGFAILNGVVSESWQQKLKERAAQIVADWDVEKEPRSIFYGTPLQRNAVGQAYLFESLDKVSCFFAPVKGPSHPNGGLAILEIGHALHRRDPVFQSFASEPAIKNIARSLGYSKPVIIQSRYFMKPPRAVGLQPHQDATFLYTTPLSCVTLWIALDNATVENGCVWAIPGSHQLGLQSRKVADPTSGLGKIVPLQGRDENYEGDYVPLEIPAGGIVVTSGELVHRSYPNKSSSTRQALILHIVEADAVFPSDNWLPRPTSASTLVLDD